MEDYVSFKTALKLKEAGFPQPTPETEHIGQMLYYDGCPTAFVRDEAWGYIAYNENFAPRVTDILLHLPEGCELIREVRPGIGENIWFVFTPSSWSRELKRKFTSPEGHANPAEAAAAMWLKLNKK